MGYRNQTANIFIVKIEKKTNSLMIAHCSLHRFPVNFFNVKVQNCTKKKGVKDLGHTKNLKVKS